MHNLIDTYGGLKVLVVHFVIEIRNNGIHCLHLPEMPVQSLVPNVAVKHTAVSRLQHFFDFCMKRSYHKAQVSGLVRYSERVLGVYTSRRWSSTFW